MKNNLTSTGQLEEYINKNKNSKFWNRRIDKSSIGRLGQRYLTKSKAKFSRHVLSVYE